MKKEIIPKTKKEIFRTHSIASKIKGWFIKIVETSNNAFLVEAIDRDGRIVSKRGSDPIVLQKEIEDELCGFAAMR